MNVFQFIKRMAGLGFSSLVSYGFNYSKNGQLLVKLVLQLVIDMSNICILIN